MLEINEIIDNDFLNKDVSELVEGDYYLFHVEHIEGCTCTYFYKYGIVFVTACDSEDVSIINKFEYTSGSLQELVEKLDEN